MYASDIGSYLQPSTQFVLYADDLKIYGPTRNENDPSFIQTAIDDVAHWCEDNLMGLSTAKCAILSSAEVPRSADSLAIQGTELPIVNKIRDVGVVLRPYFDFEGHILGLIACSSYRSRAKLVSGRICSLVYKGELKSKISLPYTSIEDTVVLFLQINTFPSEETLNCIRTI